MTRKDYLNNLYIQNKLKEKMKTDKFLLNFHLTPPSGWLNDPNGLCQFNGINHIYFQYSPFTTGWGMKLWGHYTTENWTDYTEHEPFLFPDINEDRDGVYSGSAFVKNNKIYYFYTGNVKYIDKNYNYITDGREQNVIMIESKDGYTHSDKVCILKNNDYPKNMSCHVRDPYIFEKNNSYYMVLGARSKDDKGCVLLYKSSNLKDWAFHMEITTNEKFGYMWECPAIAEIDGRTFLFCSPQGIDQKGIDFANIYQSGYFELDLNLLEKTYTLYDFKELDRGFDFYAPQIFKDEQNRNILIGWMGIPDADYTNPTCDTGWQHALTMPRELKLINNKLCQIPLNEFKKLRKNIQKTSVCNVDNAELIFDFDECKNILITLRKDIQIEFKNNILTLNLENCGFGRKTRSVKLDSLKQLQIFLDNSSIEIFVNSGNEVFTSRCYSNSLNIDLKYEGEFLTDLTWFELDKFKKK